MKRNLTAILTVLLAFSAAQAEVQIQATVDRNTVALGESLELRVSVGGEGGKVDISSIQDFKVISSGTASSINMTGTQINRETIYTYTLIPLREGALKIPALPVQSGGQTVYTQEIPIRVSQTPRQSGANDRDVFVDAEVTANTAYVGQQFFYKFKFYQAVQSANARLERPEFAGFTVVEVEERNTYKTIISGREYHVTELRYLLIPREPGEKNIGPATLKCDIVRPSHQRRGFFDDSFFGFGNRLEPRILRTPSFAVTVKPLPPYQGEDAFSGLVGRFDIQSKVESLDLKVGDSTTLAVTIQGTGNIMDAGEPKAAIPDAFKSYKDAAEESIQMGDKGYTGKKIFRMALVPVKPGDFTLSPLSLVYFDTDQGEYVKKSTRPFTVLVKPSEDKDGLEMASGSEPGMLSLKKKVEFTGRDILSLKEDLDALKTQKSLPLHFFILILLGPALGTLGVRLTLNATRRADDPARVMADRAGAALKQAGAAASSGDFFSHLYRALVSGVLSTAGVKGESLTAAEAEAMLGKAGYLPEISAQAVQLLEKIESAKFGGSEPDPARQKELLDQVKQFIRNLKP
jgi:hypothetical protein